MLLSLLVFFSPSNFSVLLISVWAGVSDFLDGLLARHWNSMTTIGARLDQIADKLFHFTLLFWLFRLDAIHLYFVLLFCLRELLIVVLRHFRVCSDSSNLLGKMKTALVYIFIVTLVVQKVYPAGAGVFALYTQIFEVTILLFSYISLYLSLRIGLKKA